MEAIEPWTTGFYAGESDLAVAPDRPRRCYPPEKWERLNGDEEIDFYENFNNDHQVTEHFHEFAMGLQRDAAGNFYYAKSARHALPAVVPHHGTLLRVSPDDPESVARTICAAINSNVEWQGRFSVVEADRIRSTPLPA